MGRETQEIQTSHINLPSDDDDVRFQVKRNLFVSIVGNERKKKMFRTTQEDSTDVLRFSETELDISLNPLFQSSTTSTSHSSLSYSPSSSSASSASLSKEPSTRHSRHRLDHGVSSVYLQAQLEALERFKSTLQPLPTSKDKPQKEIIKKSLKERGYVVEKNIPNPFGPEKEEEEDVYTGLDLSEDWVPVERVQVQPKSQFAVTPLPPSRTFQSQSSSPVPPLVPPYHRSVNELFGEIYNSSNSSLQVSTFKSGTSQKHQASHHVVSNSSWVSKCLEQGPSPQPVYWNDLFSRL